MRSYIKPQYLTNNYKNNAMLKFYPTLLTLTLITLCNNANAQYTQMIVDNNNRIMPIFFHDDENLQLQPPQSAEIHEASIAPIYNDLRPVVLPPRTLTPVIAHRQIATPYPEKPIESSFTQQQTLNLNQKQNLPRNPLTGPYFLSPERHRVLDAAYASLGTPYIYGGNNPAKGLDCSSLMQFIHKRATGTALPRTAAQQRHRSKTINYQNLQPGDMLFFKIDRRNNHVGIYIGDGKFIHASSSNRRASIASMKLPYWKKRFVKFGSYLNS